MTAKFHSKSTGNKRARWAVVAGVTALGVSLAAQEAAPAAPNPRPATPTAVAAPGTAVPQVPADYTIGPDDVLTIVFWREKDMSADVLVRPDGKISLPLLN